MKHTLVHHHTIYQAEVTTIDTQRYSELSLRDFLIRLSEHINMKVLIDPSVKLSEHNAWTGLIGIVTSHISFHYWIDENYVQMDIYSCKAYSRKKAIRFMREFWNGENEKILFINRESGKDFEICRN
jgi:S-adenosylmethionine/arginine decarboxylase-like enzyme